MNELKKGMRIDLVEILREGGSWYTPPGSQRVVYPDEISLREYNGERIFSDETCYVFGYDPKNVGNYVDFDVFLFKNEVKPIGCFIVKEVYSNRTPETII